MLYKRRRRQHEPEHTIESQSLLTAADRYNALKDRPTCDRPPVADSDGLQSRHSSQTDICQDTDIKTQDEPTHLGVDSDENETLLKCTRLRYCQVIKTQYNHKTNNNNRRKKPCYGNKVNIEYMGLLSARNASVSA